jgi:hypothetical protein
VLTALLTFAQEAAHHEGDKTPFYIAGGALAVWAVLVSALGVAKHETFPSSSSGKAGVMAITTLLVLAAMATAVLTS